MVMVTTVLGSLLGVGAVYVLSNDHLRWVRVEVRFNVRVRVRIRVRIRGSLLGVGAVYDLSKYMFYLTII
jgi:hypothetical protein